MNTCNALSLTFLLFAAAASAAPLDQVAPPQIPDRTFTLTDFSPAADGKTSDTPALRKALDACAKAGGGTVRIPAGTYLVTPFELTSHTALFLERGATLRASDRPTDWGSPESLPTTQSELDRLKGKLKPLIGGKNLTDVAIRGQGTIDGNGSWWWAHSEKAARGHPGQLIVPRPRLVQIERCARLHVQGVTLANSPSFHLVPSVCQDVLIEDAHIVAPPDSPNTDAIDPASSRRVLIRRCTLDVGDDNVAVKAGKSGPSEDILVTDCTCLHGHGLSIGSETDAGARRITFRNCTFENTHPAIRIKSDRSRGGVIEDVTYADITMKNVGTAITLNMYYADKAGAKERKQNPVVETTPILRNITIRNVTVEGAKQAGEIIGLPEMPARHVTLENVKIRADKGFTVRDAKDVELSHVQINVKSGEPVVVDHADVRQER